MNHVFNSWRIVFEKKRYAALSVVIALVFYLANVLLTNAGNLSSLYPSLGFFGTAKAFFFMSLGFYNLIAWHSFISLIIISLLLGMLFSLLLFKTNYLKDSSSKKFGVFGSVGIFLGVLAPGCAACGIGLLSVLGIGAATIAFLPFDGLEFSILAIGIMSFSIYKVSKKLTTCEIKLEKVERR